MSDEKYSALFEALGAEYTPRMVSLLENVAAAAEKQGFEVSEVYDMTDEEYVKFVMVGAVEVRLTMLEERVNDGGDSYGVAFEMCLLLEGGVEIGEFCPFNYTEDLWVSGKDKKATEERFSLFESLAPKDIVQYIAENTQVAAEIS